MELERAKSIDELYTDECAKYGDLMLKKEGIDAEIFQVRSRIQQLQKQAKEEKERCKTVQLEVKDGVFHEPK